jgi:hypothetical protein
VSPAGACENDVGAISCADSIANTWAWPNTCQALWTQL